MALLLQHEMITHTIVVNWTLTHWGRVTLIFVGKLTNIGSDNGLSPGRRQANIWTNARILLIGPLGTNFSEIFIGIHTFSFRKMDLKMSSAKCRPFCPGLNVSIDVTRWFMRDIGVISKVNTFSVLMSWEFLAKLLSGECHRTHKAIWW